MQIEGSGERSEPDDVFRLLVSRSAGIRWTSVWESQDTGSQRIDLRLRDEVAGVTECLVKVEMQAAGKCANVGLNSLRLTTVTQLNRRTLPRLTLGTNRVRLSADEQTDSTLLWPSLHAGLYRETVFQEDRVHGTERAGRDLQGHVGISGQWGGVFCDVASGSSHRHNRRNVWCGRDEPIVGFLCFSSVQL